MSERGEKKRMVGVVTSDKMDKTVVVEVERLVRHPRYEKTLRQRSRFNAHDERNEAKLGDTVELIETRPLSKTKSWRILQILRKAPGLLDIRDEAEEAPEVVGARKKKTEAVPDTAAPAPETGVEAETAPDTKAKADAAPDTEESSDSASDQT